MNIGDQVLQTLMDAIPAPIFYKDSDLIYRGCNTAFLDFIGLPRDQVLGKSVYGIAPRELADVYNKADAELLRQGGVQIYEADVRYADRSHHRVEFRKAVFIDTDTNEAGGMIGVMLDVTDLRATEAELIVAKDRAEDADRAKSRFLANISHELRTPLNAILGFSQIIGEERFGSVGNRRYVEYAHDIMRSGGSLLGLIDNILDLSRIEANQTELALTAVDPISLARQCIDDITIGGAGSVSIKLNETSDSSHSVISTDEARLRQILLNLISNATKYSKPGGIVTVIGQMVDGSFVFQIIDHGIGIAPAALESVFEPFQRVDDEVKSGSPGYGLGLPIAKALTEQLGGGLTLESRLGQGTTATVTLPLA